jgi:hypothetical protein
MGIIFVLFGICYIIFQIVKEETIKPVSKDFDARAAMIDQAKNKLSTKEFNRRVDAGYYDRKDKKN